MTAEGQMPRARRRNLDAVCFGLIFRRLRTERGLTIQSVATATGMNPKYIGTMESGGNVPSIDSLVRLSNALGVDPPEVLREMLETRKTLTVKGKKS